MAAEKASARVTKATDYISWEDFFMGVAILASKRSKDPHTKVGACIVNQNNVIVGVGYNGFPRGCSDDEFSWAKRPKYDKNAEHKHLYVCHAEANAILNKNCSSINGCRIYVTLFPCNECAKFIIQSGISEVIYMTKKPEHKRRAEYEASDKMFKAANIKISRMMAIVVIKCHIIMKKKYILRICTHAYYEGPLETYAELTRNFISS